MDSKEFTAKQVQILVGAVVVAIAFLETSHAVWDWEFWRQFMLNVFVYGLAAIIAGGLASQFFKN